MPISAPPPSWASIKNKPTTVSGFGITDKGPILGTTTTLTGTAVDLTGIPSWAKVVRVMLNAVSLSGTAQPIIQLGAGTVETTGYTSGASIISSGFSPAGYSSTTGIILAGGVQAANFFSGKVEFSSIGSNVWIENHSGLLDNVATSTSHGGGKKTLAGTLDRVRITTTNGTDTFDAGSVTLSWE